MSMRHMIGHARILYFCAIGVVSLSFHPESLASENWLENFATGVGRSCFVIDEGNSNLTHNATSEHLDCTFVREPLMNRRLALLTKTYTQEDSFAFTFEWSPVSGSLTAFPHFGFFESASGNPIIVLLVTDNRYELYIYGDPGLAIHDAGFPWSFGETYRISTIIDSEASLVTLKAWVLVNDVFVSQGVSSWNFAETEFSVDSLGVGNLVEENPGPTLVAEIDNFSFSETTTIPAISDWGLVCTALLLLLLGTLVYQKETVA